MLHDKDQVWLITGCSTGLGHELAKLVIQRGWRAIATARDASRLADLAQGERVLALDLDVTNAEQIATAIAAAREKFGRIDVLVNNAGYGYQSTVEEGEEAEIRVSSRRTCSACSPSPAPFCRSCVHSARATSSISPRWLA